MRQRLEIGPIPDCTHGVELSYQRQQHTLRPARLGSCGADLPRQSIGVCPLLFVRHLLGVGPSWIAITSPAYRPGITPEPS